jgi:hypothetical protein
MTSHLAPGHGSARAPGTRISRRETRHRQLESLAAEFALLAQRRARVAHQIDLLDHQRQAAAASLAHLQARMSWLTQHIAWLDPALQAGRAPRVALPAAPPPLPAAAPAPPPASLAQEAGRPRLMARPAPRPRGFAGKWRS